MRPTDGSFHNRVHPSLRCVPPVLRGLMLECKVWRTDLERGLMLAVRRKPEGWGRSSAANNALRGSPECDRVKYNCSVMCHHCSLSPHMPVPASTSTREVSHLSCLDCTAIASSTLPGQSAPFIVTQRAHVFQSLPNTHLSRHPACSDCLLGSSSFLPDKLVCSGTL